MFSPHLFSRDWRQLHVFASNSDWLVVLLTSLAIGQSNYFGFIFVGVFKSKYYDPRVIMKINIHYIVVILL